MVWGRIFILSEGPFEQEGLEPWPRNESVKLKGGDRVLNPRGHHLW